MNYNIIDIINKKRIGKDLSKEELEYAFNGYLNKSIPDYQMSSLLMAICIKDMNEREIFDLTDIFINSGDILDLSKVEGIKVDKHSTGGVGDKTTLVVAPLVASCGVKMAKMSGKGLGFTGGTIDKLESIPGINVKLTEEEFIKQLNDIGVAITCQTGNLTPIDKVIYALRDVTGSVESIPLIATSIMSKKIASGADKILVDIKLGNGALIKTASDANRLSELMIKIGKKYNREVQTIITDMNVPLGKYVGNSLEVIEAAHILTGKDNSYLGYICKLISSKLVSMALGITEEEANAKIEEKIKSGEAKNKFIEFIEYQKGDLSNLKVSGQSVRVLSEKSGSIKAINSYKIGCISRDLGAGRINKDDQIDYGVGIVLNKTLGSNVVKGEVLCTLFINDNSKYTIEEVLDCFEIE